MSICSKQKDDEVVSLKYSLDIVDIDEISSDEKDHSCQSSSQKDVVEVTNNLNIYFGSIIIELSALVRPSFL